MIQYNKPIEVTEKQYRYLIEEFKGIIAHRMDDDGRYWIKVWHMEYAKYIERYLTSPVDAGEKNDKK